MRKFLKFVHDDNVYCKYYEVFYILFHTGLRISEFCGLTIKDIDLKNRIINIDHSEYHNSDYPQNEKGYEQFEKKYKK